MSNNWAKFIAQEQIKPSKMYGNITTHKINNLAKVKTSGCSAAVESLSIFIEKNFINLRKIYNHEFKIQIICWV